MVSFVFQNSAKLLNNAKVIFWDFDGVIKDSTFVKIQAYVDMFAEFGVDVQNKVLLSYKNMGGMSRFQLIPQFYNDILKIKLSDEELVKKFDIYAKMVVESVLMSSYIEGIESYLSSNFQRQKFIVVTNTPKTEIEVILKRLGIDIYFESVFGAPDLKTNVVKNILSRSDINTNDCVFVGDSFGDYKAALANNVPFIYRGSENTDCYEYSLINFLNVNEMG